MLSFDHGVIATGSRVRMLPGVALIDNIVAYQQQILSADLPCVRCLFSFGGGLQPVRIALVLRRQQIHRHRALSRQCLALIAVG
jgi:dihydrolipoamide dehydrogenase